MSAAHTPGPWLIHTKHRWVVPAEDAFKEAADALPICQLRDPDERLTEDQTLANGFLIAAAPELYEALERAKDQMSAARDEVKRLRKEAGLPEQEPGGLHVAVYEAKTALSRARGDA